ncbi:unnamed protein product [Leuciscus chuanchicus]
MNTHTPPKLSNSTRLHFTESTQLTECHNHTVVEFIYQSQTQWQIIIIISGLMIGLLLIVLIENYQRLTKWLDNEAVLMSSSVHGINPETVSEREAPCYCA